MASNFTRADKKGDTTRQLAYTAPSILQSIMYAGECANVDTTNKTQHTVTIEIQKADTTFISILQDVQIPYNSTVKLPKFSLAATEKIYITCDVTNVIQGIFNILELS